MEMTREDAEKKLENMEKEIQELRDFIKKDDEKRDWPDTIEGMKEISEYWGFEAGLFDRYIFVVNGESGKGLAVGPNKTWAPKESMKGYIANKGKFKGHKYKFISFKSAKELYLWMAEGEKWT